MTDEAARVAAKLTKAQRATIEALPIDGSFGPAPNFSTAKYMWWGIGKGRETRLLEHKHEAHNEWCLNRRGLAVRAHLETHNEP